MERGLFARGGGRWDLREASGASDAGEEGGYCAGELAEFAEGWVGVHNTASKA